MTPDDYAAREARLSALEPHYAARLRAALVRQAEAVVVRLELLPALPDTMGAALLAALVSPRYLLPVLEDLYAGAGGAEARRTYAALRAGRKVAAPPAVASGWGARLRRFISQEGAAAIRGITETTRRVVRQVLGEAVTAGSSIPEAAAALRARTQALAGSRAVTIARTELIGAANAGSLLGAQAAGVAGLVKVWLATPGPRTRPEHAAASGQTAALQDGLFTVGGERARFPGDPWLSAGQRANCRCAVGYRRAEPA